MSQVFPTLSLVLESWRKSLSGRNVWHSQGHPGLRVDTSLGGNKIQRLLANKGICLYECYSIQILLDLLPFLFFRCVMEEKTFFSPFFLLWAHASILLLAVWLWASFLTFLHFLIDLTSGKMNWIGKLLFFISLTVLWQKWSTSWQRKGTARKQEVKVNPPAWVGDGLYMLTVWKLLWLRLQEMALAMTQCSLFSKNSQEMPHLGR